MNPHATKFSIAIVLFSLFQGLSPRAYAVNFADQSARDLFRFESQASRGRAAQLSNVFVSVLTASPVMISGWQGVRGDPSQNYRTQGLVRDGASLLATGALTSLTKVVVGRERPYSDGCSNPGQEAGCETGDRSRSFFSGHTSYAFTGAGLICGKSSFFGKARNEACGVALTLATATGLLRIMADQHYLTDVAVGAAVGVFSGFILPDLISPWAVRSDGKTSLSVTGVFRF